jgi:hypothetical protein
MMKRYANPRGAGTARHYKERWLADIDPPNEDLPIEDVELELLDNEYDDLWLEPDEPDRAEHRRQSDAGLDDDLDEEWKRRRRGRKPHRDHRGRRMASRSCW